MVFVNGADLFTGGLSRGLLYGILSALLYAAMIVSNKKVEKLTGLERSLVQLIFACAAVAIYARLTHKGAFPISGADIIPVLFLGTVNTGIGCYLYFSSVHELPAQSVAICGYIEPVSALLFSAVFLSEHMSIVQIAGAVLILGGAAFAEMYRFIKKRT